MVKENTYKTKNLMYLYFSISLLCIRSILPRGAKSRKLLVISLHLEIYTESLLSLENDGSENSGKRTSI